MKEKGLIKKYKIQEWVEIPNNSISVYDKRRLEERFLLKDVPEENEYFVLRLDDNCKDKIHLQACRNAILIYAHGIKDHLPALYADLTAKYGVIN
jgi:hypothetical protein